MKKYRAIRNSLRRVQETRRIDGLGRVRRGRVSRYPGIENIVNDDLSNLGEQLTYFRVEETGHGEYELFGPVYRYVDFTYKGVRFHAMSSGAGYLGLEEDGRTVYAEVLFAGSKYSDYIELTSLDDIELNSDEEDALLEQVVKRTNVVETADMIDELRDDKYTVDWVRSELKEYANTNESRRRVIESRGRVRRKAGMPRMLANRPVRGRKVTEGRLSSRRRLKASGGVHGRLRRRSVMEGKLRNPVKKTSLAERIFRVTRGESLWKLNS